MATTRQSTFELEGSDGGPLRGGLATAGGGVGRPAVIICHGFKGFKDWGFFPHLADRIAHAGYTALSFNFSGSGVGPDMENFTEQERFARATHSGDVRDIRTVHDALTTGQLGIASPPTVGLFGHSRGGGAAVLFARHTRVTALVTWNAIARIDRWPRETMETWHRDGQIDVVNARTGQVLQIGSNLRDEILERAAGDLDIGAAAGRGSCPWLIVHGEADEAVPLQDGEELYRRARRRAGDVEFRTIAGGTHTFGARHPWTGETPELRSAVDETLNWFARYL